MEAPLIVMSIELRQGMFAQLRIFKDSDPLKLAQEFVAANELPNNYLLPIKQNIMKQMCLYDAIQSNKGKSSPVPPPEKENKSPKKPIFDTEKKKPQYSSARTPEKEIEKPRSTAKKQKTQSNDTDTDKEVDAYNRLYQQSKDLIAKKSIRQEIEKKKKEQFSINDPNLTFKPVINANSKRIVTLKKTPTQVSIPTSKPSPLRATPKRPMASKSPQKLPPNFNPKSPRLNVLCQKMNPEVKVSILDNHHTTSFTQSSNPSVQETRPKLFPSTFSPPIYTEDQIENSFTEFIKKEFSFNQRVVINLFKILDCNEQGFVDPRCVPYERLSSQMIVKLRRVLKDCNGPIPYAKFESLVTKDASLMQTATEFFGSK